ncbi:hypothetical protein GCM10028812_26810 [Ancylobacter sonchi]|uniref:DeoR/GlpR family DNA-binding transcription regulator n=1 Tax=Ancylobacter sonchi TaxID=1937790 RepID=UPI0028A96DF1|nr:DeoR/GlpR family DNA-binding transcription regulator [Ancylobacter sonchi]
MEEGPFSERLRDNSAAKRLIARRAIGLFRPGDSPFVDTGTTTLCFAEQLSVARDLTIMTNSVRIAALAARGEGSKVFLVGGRHREAGAENVGPIAVERLKRFHALHAVLTVGAIDADGIDDFHEEEAKVARAMIRQARGVTIPADRFKFDGAGLFRIAPLSDIDRIVADAPPPRGGGRADPRPWGGGDPRRRGGALNVPSRRPRKVAPSFSPEAVLFNGAIQGKSALDPRDAGPLGAGL